MRKSFKWIFAIFVIASVFCGVGCKDKVEVELTPTKQYGTVKGKAFFSNENVDNHSGIQITLVATDGLRSVAYCESRGIATNARSVSDIKTTAKDGSYSFENIPVGTYTIWASSRNSVEEAIETNVNVRANEVVTANDLNLVATGNIKGTITIDGKTDGTLGLDVFIAGTSYVAKVGPTGNYEISKVPASKGYMLCVQKGEYTTIINEDLEVKAKETIEVGCKNLLSEDWAIENETQTNPTFKWLGEFATEPEDPDLYDAYYNTTDGCSYIWNGSDWDLLAKSGEDGADGKDGKDGTNGKDGEDGKDGVNGTDGKDGVDGESIIWKGELEAAPENPELNWAYYNIKTGCSYIWNGNDWDLLAKSGEDGADGEDGKDGTNGKDGVDGKDGVNGTDGKDGVSITWKGSLESAPENPELYWVYYNTTDGCSYIWNGSDWDLLAKSGEDGVDGEDGKDGVNGTDGKDGVDGLSIVWKGALEAAPENPELNWAYYNINTGCSYIWNGSDWDLLTQHAHTYEWTSDEKSHWYACACGAKKDEAEHNFGIWKVTKDPTETEFVQMQSVCEVCGETVTKELEGFRFVKGTTITGTESWTPSSSVFVSGRSLTIPDLIVSDHEVTRGEYKDVMGSDPSYTSAYDKDGNELEGDAVLNNPVNYVNWYDALVYCNKLSMQENLTPCYSIDGSTDPDDWEGWPETCDFEANGYRLPTEAEWEWLARGGENYKYAGSDNLDDVAWYTSNTNDTGTREVKTKAPNGYGLYDMSGNVDEWCWDWYVNISGATSSTLRVRRGGSWYDNDNNCQVADRGCNTPGSRSPAFGFRVVRPSTDEDPEIHVHTFAEEWTIDSRGHWKAATCEHTSEVSKFGEHSFGDWTITKEPTEEEVGIIERVCSVCNYIETAEIEKIPTGFVLIKAGTFQMGCTVGDSDEKPVHEVTLTKNFYMSKYEVTQGEYEKYCTYGESSPSSKYGIGNNYPAYYVSWYDALVYCNKRSIDEGLTPCYRINEETDPTKWGTVPSSSDSVWNAVVCDWEADGYRLPTEAEWEYAARAGDTTVAKLTYSGTSDVNELGDYAWYIDNSNSTTHEVGTKKANAFGLYDMSGNVKEWCWNWRTSEYDTTTEGGNDPTGALSVSLRVLRGGFWSNNSDVCSVSNRTFFHPWYRYGDLGFRVVRSSSN